MKGLLIAIGFMLAALPVSAAGRHMHKAPAAHTRVLHHSSHRPAVRRSHTVHRHTAHRGRHTVRHPTRHHTSHQAKHRSHHARHRMVRSHHHIRHGSRSTAHGHHYSTAHHTKRKPPRYARISHPKQRFASVRRAVYAGHRFHAGVYRHPSGWSARRWLIGQRVPRPWFVREYWISDWAVYGLWAPIDGLIWVRIGDDAVLVDPATGEVVGIEYSLFW